MHPSNVIDCLAERGFIDALTSEEIRTLVEKPIKAYVGFDPTADSLHLGNLMGIIALGWFQKYGHTPVIILGGATGRIGDPSGKSTERPLLDSAEIASNVTCIRKNFDGVLDFFHPRARPLLLNNDDWYANFSVVDFLRDVGKHFRINTMLSKDTVRTRLDSEEGMSFTEFSYSLLQSYDFYHLLIQHGVILQMGGSDQWGNIVAGIELNRKLAGRPSYGLTWPLITRSDGKKFGKSEEGAIWLSPDRLSPYQFYQYLVRVPDADVIKLMRLLTFMEMAEIAAIEEQMKQSDYVPNTAQKRLAREITLLIHGEEGLQTALRVTEAASPGAKAALDLETLKEIAKDMPHCSLSAGDVIGQKYIEVAVKAGLMPSKGEASRLIQNGGAYLNDEKVDNVQKLLEKEDLIGNKFLLIGSGKKKKILIELT